MREVHHQFFYGSGDGVLVAECQLRERFSKAFSMIGGLQQPPPCTTPKKLWDQLMEENAEGWDDIYDLVEDIAMAMTGEKIRFCGEPKKKRRKRHR